MDFVGINHCLMAPIDIHAEFKALGLPGAGLPSPGGSPFSTADDRPYQIVNQNTRDSRCGAGAP
jgi:hypothetical protein